MATKKNTPVETPVTLEEAIAVIVEKNKEIADKDAAIAELNNVIAELRATPAPGAKPSFELAGKKYEVNAASFKYKRETVTASELCSNTALQAELVAKQIGFITEITD